MINAAMRARVADTITQLSRASAKYPHAVHAVAGASTWMLGNVLTQYQSARGKKEGRFKLNVRELLIYGAYGSVLSNVGHGWYRRLHVVTNRTMNLSKVPMIGAKLAADMFIFNPIHVTALILWTHTLRQRPMSDLQKEFEKEFLPMVGAEAAIWTPVQMLNFWFLPVKHQQTFVNMMAVVEAAVLSWLSQLDEEDKKEIAAMLPMPTPPL